MGRVLVIKRRQDPAVVQGLAITVRAWVGAAFQHFFNQTVAFGNCAERQLPGRVGGPHHMDFIAFNNTDVSRALGGFKLD